jgi:hypothetical protein
VLNGVVGFSVFFQYTARKFQANHEGLELNVLHQVLVYDGDDVNLGEKELRNSVYRVVKK